MARSNPTPAPTTEANGGRRDRFWGPGSAIVVATLVLLGGTGAADGVYTFIGRHNLFIVGGLTAFVVVRALRRSKPNRAGTTDRVRL